MFRLNTAEITFFKKKNQNIERKIKLNEKQRNESSFHPPWKAVCAPFLKCSNYFFNYAKRLFDKYWATDSKA